MRSFDFAQRTDRNEKEMKLLRVECIVLFYFCSLNQIRPDLKRQGGDSRASTGLSGKGAMGRGKEPQSPRSNRSVLHFLPPTRITLPRDKCRVSSLTDTPRNV